MVSFLTSCGRMVPCRLVPLKMSQNMSHSLIFTLFSLKNQWETFQLLIFTVSNLYFSNKLGIITLGCETLWFHYQVENVTKNMSRNSTINRIDLVKLLQIAYKIIKIEWYNNIFMTDKLQNISSSPSKENF